MSKLILRCNYLKNALPSHLSNYIHYISTREGVEKVDNTTALLPATVKQKELIADILSKIEDASKMHEYYDYLQKPNRANASEFITQTLENNLDIIAKKKNYIDYLANRPRVERIGTHGLFSNEGENIVLSKVAEEVANHEGVVWTNVISLRREDAERLGYDSAAQWQSLIRSRIYTLCENYKIDSANLKWYAAFHNESHHPHVHLVVYSTNPSEGYLTKRAIEEMRSVFAHDIFRQDFMSIYEKKNVQRDELKAQARKSLLFLLQQLQNGVCYNGKIAEQMQLLSMRLRNTNGKKVYGYLKADVKAIVNGIVDELAKEDMVAVCYQKWLESKNEIVRLYKDVPLEDIPLSQQYELKSIKNMVIREAVRYGSGYLYAEDEGMEELLSEKEEQTGETIAGLDEIVTDYEVEVQETKNTGNYYAKWTKEYKQAREYLYGTETMEANPKMAYELMQKEAERGNAYALHDIGKMYAQGIGVGANQKISKEWYRQALIAMHHVETEREDAYLEYRIGKMYQYGLGTDEDATEAARWFSLACEKEHKYALYSLAMQYMQGKGVEQDDVQAYELMKRSHEKGNPYASYELGKLYEKGRDTEQNEEQTDNCYRIAFLGFLNLEKKSKDDNLWYRIGCMYLHGMGTEPDKALAEKFLLMSAEYGNAHAAYQLAKMYIRQEKEKLSQEPDAVLDMIKIEQAVKWLIEQAEMDNAFAEYALGKLYADGQLMARDWDKAIYYLSKAAEKGNCHAGYKLGMLFLSDERRDIQKAVHYLSLSVKQNNEFALYRLGILYMQGEEVEKDMEQALSFFEQSAKLGNQYAQYMLGKIYLMGRDVETDREKAYMYLNLAAAQGNVYAAFFLEHWNDMSHPDLLLMATRLMKHLEHVMEDELTGRRGTKGVTDRKLARKIKSKKIAQGHAADDSVEMVQTQ